jgi:hypothetical protein
MGLAGGGVIFSQGVAALLEAQATLGALKTTAPLLVSNGPYRPPEWSKAPQTCVITQPGGPIDSTTAQVTSINGNSASADFTFNGAGQSQQQQASMYVFDAILQADHDLRLTKTRHPVQGASSVCDHAYIEPAVIVLDVLMSDAMDSYSTGMWTGSSSKSVSAFEVLKNLRDTRTFVSLTTRLFTYKNMLVEFRATDTYKTAFGLRARVTFSEIFLAGAASANNNNNSARPQTTNSTSQGTVGAQAPSASTIALHQVSANNPSLPNAVLQILKNAPIPGGAGTWDSNNISGVVKVYANMGLSF